LWQADCDAGRAGSPCDRGTGPPLLASHLAARTIRASASARGGTPSGQWPPFQRSGT
jgi:hypothetical protein